jgi:hypothetical protein
LIGSLPSGHDPAKEVPLKPIIPKRKTINKMLLSLIEDFK